MRNGNDGGRNLPAQTERWVALRLAAAAIVCLLNPTASAAQVAGLPITPDPHLRAGWSVAAHISSLDGGAGGGTAVVAGPLLRTGDFTFAAYGGHRWRTDERRFAVIGGTFGFDLLSLPSRSVEPGFVLAAQFGIARELFRLDPEAAFLEEDVPAQLNTTMDVAMGFRVPVSGLVLHPWLSAGVRSIGFDVDDLRGTKLPDFDVYGGNHPAVGAGVAVPLTSRMTLQTSVERSRIRLPDPRPERGFERASSTLVMTIGLLWHASGPP